MSRVNHNNVNWGDESDPDSLISKAIALHKEGLSNSQIAARLNCGTRMAVGGKLYRLGYCRPAAKKEGGREGAIKTRKRLKKRGRPAVAPKHNPHLAQTYAPEEEGEALVARTGEAIEVPLAQRKKLVDLEPNHCRFPYGDVVKDPAEFYFCGGEKVPGLAYCQAHAETCFETQAAREARSKAAKLARTGFSLPSKDAGVRRKTAAQDQRLREWEDA